MQLQGGRESITDGKRYDHLQECSEDKEELKMNRETVKLVLIKGMNRKKSLCLNSTEKTVKRKKCAQTFQQGC
jgi:hypothetical protein